MIEALAQLGQAPAQARSGAVNRKDVVLEARDSDKPRRPART